MKIILGITETSGAVLAMRAIDYLMERHEVYVVAGENGGRTFKDECGTELYDFLRRRTGVKNLCSDRSFPSIADVSKADRMIILPCSAAAAGQIAAGSGSMLLTKAADVMLKERKPLLIAFSDSPVSLVTLRNLETLCLCGAVIYPVSPPFYFKPQNIDRLYDMTLGRILLSAGIENDLI